MANGKPALIDDDEDDAGEDVLNDIASSGAGQGERPAQQRTNGNGQADDVEIVIEDEQPADEGDDGQDDQGDARFTEDEQPSASYLDQGPSKNTRRARGRERTRVENAQLRARLAASDARFNTVEAELANLRKFAGRVEPQLAQFSEAQLQGRLTNVDNQIARAAADLDAAEKAFVDALGENDTQTALKAMRTRDQAFIATEKLKNEKAQIATAITAAGKDRGKADDAGKGAGAEDQGGNGQGKTGTQLPPKARTYLREFGNRFPWFDIKSTNPKNLRDSKIVSVLDDEVMGEGFDPNDPSYWQELENRMREAVPHRLERERNDDRNDSYSRPRQPARPQARNEQRRGPPVAAPGNGGGPRQKIFVKLTPERREALMQAQVIDGDGRPIDEAKFRTIVKEYAELDRANGAGR